MLKCADEWVMMAALLLRVNVPVHLAALGPADGRFQITLRDPETRLMQGHEDVVKIQFVCGYGAAADVPDKIKQAIRYHAAWHFRNREGQKMPDTFYKLLRKYSLARPQKIGAAE